MYKRSQFFRIFYLLCSWRNRVRHQGGIYFYKKGGVTFD